MFFHHLHSFGRSEAKQGPVSILEDHSAENLPFHCLPSSFSLCLASPSCLVLRHPWQEVKPWTGWQHSSPQSLVGELEDSCQELRWQTSLDDHSGKFPQAESSAAVFSIVVLRKPSMLLPLLMHSWLSPWSAESPSQYICVFYSWSPSVLVYFCSFIHVHPDEIPHFLLTPQQIDGWSLKEMCLHQSEGLGELRNRRVFPPCARKLHQQGSFKGCCVTCFLGGVVAGLPRLGLSFPCLLAHHLGPSSDKCRRIRRLPWIPCEDTFSPLHPPAPSPSPASLFSSALTTTFHLLSAFATTP